MHVADLSAALTSVVGDAHLRAAEARDTVAGVAPSLVVSPATEKEVASTLRACAAADAGVVVRGGGTAMDWGAPPRRADVLLSTARLEGVVDHAAADMVCVVRAGTRMCDLQVILATRGQRLALDPPRPAASTVGGTLATDHAGGLRHRFGTPRDRLIGARFVLSDGTIASSGGRVVKNVAGYDVGRMLCGSLGSLAVIVEAAFAVHPLPAARVAIVVDRLSPASLADTAARITSLPAPVAALDAYWPDGLLVAWLEGTEAGVRAGADALVSACGGDLLADSAATDLDGRMRLRPWEGDGLVAGIGVPVSRLAGLVEACSDFAVEAVVRASVGAAEARVPADAGVVSAFRAAVDALGGHLVLRRGGSTLPDLAWGEGDAVAADLALSVKRGLDPAGTLASGRRQGQV